MNFILYFYFHFYLDTEIVLQTYKKEVAVYLEKQCFWGKIIKDPMLQSASYFIDIFHLDDHFRPFKKFKNLS